MNEFEQKGYDSWVSLWAEYGCSPSATQCPARHMPEGQNRMDFIHGWNVAKAAGQIIKEVGGNDLNGGTLYSENLY